MKAPANRRGRLLVILALVAAGGAPAAHAVPYASLDPASLVRKNPGGPGGTVDMAGVDRMIRDLAPHAQDYPPQFDSPADAQRARRDIATLAGMLDVLARTEAPSPDVLLRLGLLSAFGHSLDIPHAAERAQGYFTRLLAVQPEHPYGNYHYGVFLLQTGQAQAALPFLAKAKDRGVTPALFSLGLAYIMLNDAPRAQEWLTAYQKANPADASVAPLLEAVREGKIYRKPLP